MFELIPIDRHMRRIAGFDPFREFEEMERSFFGGATSAMTGFRTDVSDMGEAYKLECELPGFKKEDIQIDIENDCLTITAERRQSEEDKSTNYIKRERYYGSFSRSFDVSGIEVDGIEAAYNDGILTLHMPKRAELMPVSRKLEIK